MRKDKGGKRDILEFRAEVKQQGAVGRRDVRLADAVERRGIWRDGVHGEAGACAGVRVVQLRPRRAQAGDGGLVGGDAEAAVALLKLLDVVHLPPVRRAGARVGVHPSNVSAGPPVGERVTAARCGCVRQVEAEEGEARE